MALMARFHFGLARRTVCFAVIALSFALCPEGLGAIARSVPSAEQVIEKARAAVGYEHLRRYGGVVELQGEASYCEVPGEASFWFTASGRFRLEMRGRVSQTVAFDGEKGWMLDWTGMPRPLELEQFETTQAAAWVTTGRWLAEDGPFTVSVVPEETNDEHVMLLLKRRSGLLEARLMIDRSTWLPVTLRWPSQEGTDTWEMSDYREFMGFHLPFQLANRSGWGNVQQFRFATVAVAGPTGGDVFAEIAPPPDTHFDGGQPNSLLVKRGRQGHLFVHPLINGRDVGWFFFDTCGSALIITPSAGDQADMPAFGKAQAVGMGGPVGVRFRSATSYQLGPVTVDNPVFGELDLSMFAGLFDGPVAGIIGYDLLARCVTEIDPVAGRVALYNPDAYVLSAGHWQEIFIGHGHPHVRATFEGGREGVFRLDTGNPGGLLVHAPTVAQFGLLDNREVASCRLGGAGGFKPARCGTLDWFELGGHRFEKPRVVFSLADEGSMTSRWVAGTIGMELMRPFRIVLDCPHKRIALVQRKPG